MKLGSTPPLQLKADTRAMARAFRKATAAVDGFNAVLRTPEWQATFRKPLLRRIAAASAVRDAWRAKMMTTQPQKVNHD